MLSTLTIRATSLSAGCAIWPAATNHTLPKTRSSMAKKITLFSQRWQHQCSKYQRIKTLSLSGMAVHKTIRQITTSITWLKCLIRPIEPKRVERGIWKFWSASKRKIKVKVTRGQVAWSSRSPPGWETCSSKNLEIAAHHQGSKLPHTVKINGFSSRSKMPSIGISSLPKTHQEWSSSRTRPIVEHSSNNQSPQQSKNTLTINRQPNHPKIDLS